MSHHLQEIQKNLKTFAQVLEEFPDFRYVGDPILRHATEKVDVKSGQEIGEKLGEVLLRYREISGIGRGLAAPQIGINKSVFVTYIDNQLETFINPTIVDHSQTTNFYRELCLSSGIFSADVERYEWITLQWTDTTGKVQTKKCDGFLARLYQHEEAHLRGKVNIDEAREGGIEFLSFDPLKEEFRKS